MSAVLFFVILFGDQLTKWIATSYLKYGESVPVIPDFFNYTLVHNKGAAFGMFAGLEDFHRQISLAVVSFLALLVIYFFLKKEVKDDTVSQKALYCVLAGAFGNIIDRIRFDYVVDFLDFYYKNYHWPAFNVADMAISIGVSILIIRMVFQKKPKVSSQ
jgi:signal peptidase II